MLNINQRNRAMREDITNYQRYNQFKFYFNIVQRKLIVVTWEHCESQRYHHENHDNNQSKPSWIKKKMLISYIENFKNLGNWGKDLKGNWGLEILYN